VTAPTGLLVDYGGVLTTDVLKSFSAFCSAEGLAPEEVAKAFRHDPDGRAMLEDLECGRLSEADFEPRLAALIGVKDHTGLIDRLFGGMRADTAMVEAVRAARRAGIRTGLLSNSWGADRYEREAFPELFDVLVISGEEGVRKPEPEIYALAVERMALPAESIVFVDDLPFNLKPARALGMTTVHHTSAEETVPELERLLGYSVASSSR
jgi:epoxide hydrolase-like predicted phosphatase